MTELTEIYEFNFRFGLIMPKKAQLSAPRAVNVFGDDSDQDDDDGVDKIQKSWKAESGKSQIKKQALIHAKKALEEDPTIFQYDEIHSQIHVDTEKKKEEKKKQEPKYIKKLLQNAEKRKRENELRIERMVQKEREAEGDMFKDKEKFVTASYRKKLEENKKLEEEEKESERLEAIGDVTKQVNIDGIYRHLYSQTFDIDSNKQIRKFDETKKEKEKPTEKNIDADDSSVNDSSSDEKTKAEALKIVSKNRKGKQYRKRGTEIMESESDDEKGEKVEEEKKESKEKGEKEIEKEKEILETNEKEKSRSNIEISECTTSGVKRKEREENENGQNKEELSNSPNKRKKEDERPKPRKPERNVTIWIKRTVGPVFEAALQRYYARQAAKASSS